MHSTNTLKTKFSLFVIAVAFILLFSLLGYLYFSYKYNIEKQAQQETDIYLTFMQSGFQNELINGFYELNTFLLQNSNITAPFSETGKSRILDISEIFFRTYTNKYSQIIFYFPSHEQAVQIQPVEVFGGERKVVSTQRSLDELQPDCQQLIKLPDQRFVAGPADCSGAQSLFFKISAENNNGAIIIATIPLSYVFDILVSNYRIPQHITAVVTDFNGTILFSTNESSISKKIQNYSAELKNIHNGLDESFVGNFYWRWLQLKPAEIALYLSRDNSVFISRFHNLILNIFLFSVVLIISVIIVVQILASRMAKIFLNITSVTAQIGAGDFSQKISIQRKDELGELINAFNKMVEELSLSYSQLNLVNRELEEKINELIKTRAELSQKQKLALIGETVSKISHEIQNKIGAVSIWIQNLEMQAGEDQNVKLYVQQIKAALNSFMEMLMNFKRFYREPEISVKKIDICVILDQIVYRVDAEARQRGIDIRKDFSDGPVCLELDQARMEEVFLNILYNSIYFSPESGKIGIEIKQSNEFAKIVFTNQGPHIPDKNMDKIFQPFFTTKSSGSGLGLAMAYNIIKAHKGEIRAENQPESGVQFIIRLPISG